MIDVSTGRASIDAETTRSLELLRRLDDWTVPTRLHGWSVADLAGHLVVGQRLQADAWGRVASGDTGAVTASAPDSTDRAELLDSLETANRALSAALAAVTDEQAASAACAMPYGTLPAPFVLLVAVLEAGVHRSDVAAAAGEDDALDERTVEAGAIVLGGTLPMLGAAGDGTAPLGASVVLRASGIELAALRGDDGWTVGAAPEEPTTTISGTPSDVVLFALGRRGAEAMDVVGDRTGADRFKAWFPGP
jgi:uncharacterized protein (TIGR03083 family)